jgi:phospholipid/cholesterol/gamma-HCH transport system substrate-binding protein
VSRSLTRLQAILLGLVILTGLGLTVGGLFAVGSKYWPWNDTFDLRVPFPRAVEVGTRVRVQGIDAGEVAEVGPPSKPGEPVMLTLRLAGHWKKQNLIRANATAQIVSEGMVGSKVIDINPGTADAEPVQANAVIRSEYTPELADALAKVGRILEAVENEKGRVTGLVDNTSNFIRQGQDTMKSIQHGAEDIQDVVKGVKRVPIIRNYVEDSQAILVRPECECNQWVLPETSLFESGRSQLTVQGRQRLDDIAKRVNELKHNGSEVVVVAYADPKTDAAFAATLTEKQSEVVAGYLKDHHSVHKMGWLSTRPVKALGMGVKPPPAESGRDDTSPPARVEVLVFVPRKE